MVDHTKALDIAMFDDWQNDGIDNLQEAYIDLHNKVKKYFDALRLADNSPTNENIQNAIDAHMKLEEIITGA